MPKQMYSIQQAVAEIVADKEQCFLYAKRLANSRKFRMAVKNLDRHRTNVYFKPVTWKSKRDNDFLILLGVSSKKDAKTNGMFLTIAMLFSFEGVLHAATFGDIGYSTRVDIFKYHFFKRYNERFLKQPELDIKDVIGIFIRSNPHCCCRKMETKKFQNSYAFLYPDGVGFGNYYPEKKYCILNTFVTRMMLFKNQSEMVKDLKEYVDNISAKSWAEIRDVNNVTYPNCNVMR